MLKSKEGRNFYNYLINFFDFVLKQMNMQITNNNKKCSESHARVQLEARSGAVVQHTNGYQQS